MGNGLAPNRRQTITGTNAKPIHRRIYAALVEDGLMVQSNLAMYMNVT